MPTARFTVISLGVADVRTSSAFYERLGFARKLRAAGDDVGFFVTGATVLSLYPWDKLAAEAGIADVPRPAAFRGVTLAWNCNTREDVATAFAHAVASGARAIQAPQPTHYGGYAGYFADPDGHVWEVVTAPGLTVEADGRLTVPD